MYTIMKIISTFLSFCFIILFISKNRRITIIIVFHERKNEIIIVKILKKKLNNKIDRKLKTTQSCGH